MLCSSSREQCSSLRELGQGRFQLSEAFSCRHRLQTTQRSSPAQPHPKQEAIDVVPHGGAVPSTDGPSKLPRYDVTGGTTGHTLLSLDEPSL